jgi:GTP-binding protein
LLLHLIELPAYEGMPSPVEQFHQLSDELVKFSEQLQDKTRWLVFTKADITVPEEARAMAEEYVKAIGWQGPYYVISSVARQGLESLIKDIAEYLSEAKFNSQN